MSKNNNVPTNEVPEGFFRGLMGRDVKDENDNVIKTVFAAQPKGESVVSYENVETLYPSTDDAALECAKDCETRVYVLVPILDADGETVVGHTVEERKLVGLAAAVTIAKRIRVDESFRARVRSGKTTERELRDHALATLGFTLPGASKSVTMDGAALAAIFADPNASAEDRLAATMALLAASGVKVS